MKLEVTKSVLWNEGSKAGLALGLVPVVYLFVNHAIENIQSHAILTATLSFLLWAVKFGLCLWLMRYFMLKFAGKYAVDNSLVFKFGVVAALCSSLIVAAVSLADVLIIHPDYISDTMATVVNSYSNMLDSNSLQAIEKVEGMMPQITFFSNLIYCFLFGVLLSLIYSRYIPPRNPFAMMDDTNNDQNGTEVQ